MLDRRGGCSGSSWCVSSGFVLAQLCRQGRFALFGSRRRLSRMIASGFVQAHRIAQKVINDSGGNEFLGKVDGLQDLCVSSQQARAGHGSMGQVLQGCVRGVVIVISMIVCGSASRKPRENGEQARSQLGPHRSGVHHQFVQGSRCSADQGDVGNRSRNGGIDKDFGPGFHNNLLWRW
jgi:hypothetical protein